MSLLLEATKASHATVVSGYFPIPSKFSPEQYLFWVKSFLENIPCHLVFFTDPRLVDLLQGWRGKYNDRTVFVPFDFPDNSEAFKKYGHPFWEKQLELDQEYDYNDKTRKIHSPELYAIWYEKKEFVLKAIAMNPFGHEKYLWADAGGFRIQEWFPQLQTFAQARNIHDNRFFLLNIEPFQEGEAVLIDRKEPRVGGGYLAAHKDTWPIFSKKYDDMMQEYSTAGIFAGKDQNLMASMYLREPDFFDLVPTDNSSKDPWFWPQLYFAETNKLPEITVLIPLYNGIEFLRTSLTSVYKQTYSNWRVIIAINGHKPDSEVYELANQTVQVLEDYLQMPQRTDILQLSTKGKPASMNAATAYIKTEWTAILDADDIWLPDKLAEQVAVIIASSISAKKVPDVIGTQAQYFGDSTIIPNIPVGDLTGFDFFSVNPIINSSVLMRTYMLCYDEKETTGLEDYELWLRLRYDISSVKFSNISKVLVGHRIHKESAFNNSNASGVEDLIKRKKVLQV